MALTPKYPDHPSSSAHNPNQWSVIWKLALPKEGENISLESCQRLTSHCRKSFGKKKKYWKSLVVCCSKMESISYALFECRMSRKIWQNSLLEADFHDENIQDIVSLLYFWPQQRTELDGELVVAFFWVIWNARDRCCSREKKENPTILMLRSKKQWCPLLMAG